MSLKTKSRYATHKTAAQTTTPVEENNAEYPLDPRLQTPLDTESCGLKYFF